MAMTHRADMYRKNAVECEREGLRAPTSALKRKYRDLAQQWREMAEQAQHAAEGKPTKRSTART
jgi:hypothetical protein